MPPERPEDFVLRVTRRIADIRKAKGLTQDDLAEALGTATRNVQRLEAGQNLTLHTIARIAAALAVRPEDLFAGDSSERRPRGYGQIPTAAHPVVHGVAERPKSRPRKRK